MEEHAVSRLQPERDAVLGQREMRRPGQRDVQRLIGIREFSLAALVQRYFNIELAKGSQKANWARRPLPVRMLEYVPAAQGWQLAGPTDPAGADCPWGQGPQRPFGVAYHPA